MDLYTYKRIMNQLNKAYENLGESKRARDPNDTELHLRVLAQDEFYKRTVEQVLE